MDFDIFDSHVHLYPDRIAVQVTASLGGKFGNAPAFLASVDGCRAHDARAGVSVSLNLPVATSPDQVVPINRWAKAVNDAAHEPKRGDEPRILSLAALHPALPDLPAQVEAIAAAGFAGVKLHPEYQLFTLDDPRMDPCWEALAAHGLVAYLHAGGERVFRPPFHTRPADFLALHRRFPGLTLVAAHLGGYKMWDEAERLLCGTGIYLDLAHVFGWCEADQALRIIRRHGADRVLFATDAPWQDPADVVRAILALPIPDADRRKILSGNARRLFAPPV